MQIRWTFPLATLNIKQMNMIHGNISWFKKDLFIAKQKKTFDTNPQHRILILWMIINQHELLDWNQQ